MTFRIKDSKWCQLFCKIRVQLFIPIVIKKKCHKQSYYYIILKLWILCS